MTHTLSFLIPSLSLSLTFDFPFRMSTFLSVYKVDVFCLCCLSSYSWHNKGEPLHVQYYSSYSWCNKDTFVLSVLLHAFTNAELVCNSVQHFLSTVLLFFWHWQSSLCCTTHWQGSSSLLKRFLLLARPRQLSWTLLLLARLSSLPEYSTTVLKQVLLPSQPHITKSCFS